MQTIFMISKRKWLQMQARQLRNSFNISVSQGWKFPVEKVLAACFYLSWLISTFLLCVSLLAPKMRLKKVFRKLIPVALWPVALVPFAHHLNLQNAPERSKHTATLSTTLLQFAACRVPNTAAVASLQHFKRSTAMRVVKIGRSTPDLKSHSWSFECRARFPPLILKGDLFLHTFEAHNLKASISFAVSLKIDSWQLENMHLCDISSKSESWQDESDLFVREITKVAFGGRSLVSFS